MTLLNESDMHDYQVYAKDFIESRAESALFLDLGLGKTVIALTAIRDFLFDYFISHKVLIVAPVRVAQDQWPKEIKSWTHLNYLKYSLVLGTAKQRLKALQEKADIYIINRENIQWLVETFGSTWDFDTVVLDELSSFKSYSCKRFRSLMSIRPKIDRIIGLTGTPAPNNLMDLFAEIKILDCGKRLGRFITNYRDKYFLPDVRNGAVVYSYKLKPGSDKKIYDAISDMTISMQACDHLKMPKLISTTWPVKMDKDEEKVYKSLKNDLVLDLQGQEITASSAATLCMKLTQLSSGAIYSDDGSVVKVHDRKLDALEDIIEASCGKSLLVAYYFKHDLARIEERLKKLKVKYAVIGSSESINAWNRGEIQVGLIHPQSCGMGLNLQDGGNTLVWFSLTWSLQDYIQLCGRINRQGQKAETVVIQHIVCEDTIDERILKALESKEMTQSRLLDAVKAVV